MFDTHPHITKEELIELFPSGMMPHKAMEALANEELAKDELHVKLKEIAQDIGEAEKENKLATQEEDWEDDEDDEDFDYEDDEDYDDLFFTLYLCKVDKENKTVEIYGQKGVEEEKDLHATIPLEIQGEVNPLLEPFITSLSIFSDCELYVEEGEENVVINRQNFREKFGLTDSVDL